MICYEVKEIENLLIKQFLTFILTFFDKKKTYHRQYALKRKITNLRDSTVIKPNHHTIIKLWNYNKLTYNNCVIHILENSFKWY